MALCDEFETQGKWLFRWRSYIPLVLISLILASLRGYTWPFGSHAIHEIWARSCLVVSFVGLAIRCATVGYVPAGTSGRNAKRQLAKVLNTTGMYSLVRHPLYLGNFFIGLGVAMVPVVWWLPAIYCLLFWIYYERIMYTEERFLHRTFGKEFDDWAARTPAIVPHRFVWQTPPLEFSFRSVLRREYTGLMVVVLANAGVEFTEHLILDRRVVYETFWVTTIIAATTIYFALRTLKKYTSVLNVPGR